MELRGSLCVLRPFSRSDVDALAVLLNDFDVVQWMTRRIRYPYSAEDAAAWIEQNLSSGPQHHFVIEVQERLAGGIGMDFLDDLHSGSGEFGYWLGKDHWGKGIATEGVALFEAYAFSIPTLRRLQSHVCSPNAASIRVLEKNGFVREGILRLGGVDRQDNPIDLEIFGKLSPSYASLG